MYLAVDVGNTNTVFALADGGALRASWRIQTERRRTPDEYAAFLGHMFALEGVAFSEVTDAIVCSVVPETGFALTRFFEKYLSCLPVFVTKDDVGIEVDLERAEDVGADRLVNARAVLEEYKGPVIVIDFGTATTFDVIDAKGRYAGGAIAPGIELSLEALHAAASKLPKIGVSRPGRAIGKTTVEAMRSGIFWGYAGLIEGIVKRIRAELGDEAARVLATGGLAPLFAQTCDFIDRVDADLTLKGLILIHQQLKGGTR
jgi:type III pantothenate kinase